jgi:hypothetical protein
MQIERAPSQRTPQFAAADWFLQHLVSHVNDFPVELPITLQVSGMFVSGQLVSDARYFEGIAGDSAHGLAAHPEIAESVRKSFNSVGPAIGKTDSNAVAPGPAPHFLHLQNARFSGATAKHTDKAEGIWWRGRVSEVDGFSLGQADS